MAFPTVAEITENQDASDTTTHPVDIPALLGVDRILLFIEFHDGAFGDLEGHPEGFVTLGAFGGHAGCVIRAFYFAPALLPVLGVERFRPIVPGGTVTLTTQDPCRCCIYAIAFAEPLLLSYFQFADQGGGATAIDPPNLVYSGSAKDVLWWSMGSGGQFDFGSHSTGYTLHQHDGETKFAAAFGGFGDCAMAARELNAASENPGIILGTGPTSDWHSVTMGVALDGP